MASAVVVSHQVQMATERAAGRRDTGIAPWFFGNFTRGGWRNSGCRLQQDRWQHGLGRRRLHGGGERQTIPTGASARLYEGRGRRGWSPDRCSESVDRKLLHQDRTDFIQSAAKHLSARLSKEDRRCLFVHDTVRQYNHGAKDAQRGEPAATALGPAASGRGGPAASNAATAAPSPKRELEKQQHDDSDA